MSPFLNISSQSLVRITNSTVKVAKLISDHIFHVALVEIVGQSFLEVDGESFVQKV